MKRKVFVLAAAFLLGAFSAAFGLEAEGYASWYGGKFVGRTTANGEVFDTNSPHRGAQDPPLRIQGAGHQPREREIRHRPHQRPRTLRGRPDHRPFPRRGGCDRPHGPRRRPGEARCGAPGRAGALRHAPARLLRESGQRPPAEKNGSSTLASPLPWKAAEKGHTRILLENLPEESLEETKQRLTELGFKSIIVRNSPH